MPAKSPFRLTPANPPAQPKKPDILALGRMKAGVRNSTEADYEKLLETRRCIGEVLWYRFEGITLRIAKGVSYTPDFVVMLASGEIELHEVKGYWRDDSRAKTRIAAEQFPFRIIAITRPSKKKGAGWVFEEM
jgi:hypothetical protein